MPRIEDTLLKIVLVVLGPVVTPFTVCLLAVAASESFFGNKEPMLEAGLGLMAGVFLGIILMRVLLWLYRRGRIAWAWILLVLILAFHVSAIPVARWLIREASASPTGVIQWR